MSHIIPAEHSKANLVQQGHDFSKVFPWVIAEAGREYELQASKQGILLTREVILSVKDRVQEGKTAWNRYPEIDIRSL